MEYFKYSHESVGGGLVGFDGLNFRQGLRRWLQAWSAPDLWYIDVVKWAMPVMLLFVLIEFIASLILKKRIYYVRQFWSNLAGGGTSFLLLGVLLRGATVFPYIYVHKVLGLRKKIDWITYMIGFLGYDFSYYAAHRLAHASNLGWATHVMHHSSPDFTFMTAIRLSPDALVVFWIFFLPLALVVPPKVFFIFYGCTYAYQFLVHTQLIHKFPRPIEYFLMTPSNHRVHHARNYPRSNFGAILMIWDRMLGSAVDEQDDKPCLYGLDARQKTLGTHNPSWHQVQHLWVTLKAASKMEGMDKLRMLFTRMYGPGMVKPTLTDAEGFAGETDMLVVPGDEPAELPPNGVPCDPTINWMDLHVLVHGIVLGAAAFFIMAFKIYLDPFQMFVVTIHLMHGFHCILAILDDQTTWFPLYHELVRMFITSGLVFWVFTRQITVMFAAFTVVSACALPLMYYDVYFKKKVK